MYTYILLSWADLAVESTRIIVAIQKARGEGGRPSIRKIASNENVLIKIDHNKLKILDTIKVDHIDLIGFYYADSILTQEQIKLIVKEKIGN